MTESPAPNKFTQWKRPLIGGLLSALIAGIALVVLYKFDFFLFVGFITIGMIIPNIFLGGSNLWISVLSIVFWFFAGSVITHYFKNNKVIGVWIILYIVSFIFRVLYFPWFFPGIVLITIPRQPLPILDCNSPLRVCINQSLLFE